MTKKEDEDFEKTVDALRALIGGSPVARSVVDAQQSLKKKTEQLKNTEEKDEYPPVPKAFKTFQVVDFVRIKKHRNDQIMFMLKKFVEKHGKVEKDSKEFNILMKAISRLKK